MRSSTSTLKFNLPTILTLSRIVVIPLFIYVTPASNFLGAVIFSLASITDFLDGYLARLKGEVTKFGIIVDPIADKFLVIAALIVLVDMGRISVWIAVIVIVREFLVTALRAVALSKDIIIKAEMGGKLKVTAQITAIICLILANWTVLGLDLYDVGIIAIWISIVLSIISGVQYLVTFWITITTAGEGGD
jgi:CDP-diacylglycerol--glycerol-3-phosphate 3-phosphatidyltransferase